MSLPENATLSLILLYTRFATETLDSISWFQLKDPEELKRENLKPASCPSHTLLHTHTHTFTQWETRVSTDLIKSRSNQKPPSSLLGEVKQKTSRAIFQKRISRLKWQRTTAWNGQSYKRMWRFKNSSSLSLPRFKTIHSRFMVYSRDSQSVFLSTLPCSTNNKILIPCRNATYRK